MTYEVLDPPFAKLVNRTARLDLFDASCAGRKDRRKFTSIHALAGHLVTLHNGASKAALVGLTRQLAAELYKSLYPLTSSAMTRLTRLATEN